MRVLFKIVTTLVYIAGFSYSGSTLLAMILGAHPQMGTTGEIAGPPHFERNRGFLCSCGSEIERCPFYADLEKRMDSPDFRLAEGKWGTRALSQPPRLHEKILCGSLRSARLEHLRDVAPILQARLSRVRELNARFVDAACQLLGTSTLIDSSKDPMRVSLLKRISGLRLKAIHLVRHPAGCVQSAMRYHGYSASLGAQLWRRTFRTTRRQLSKLPQESRMHVRYEDLCRSPEHVFRELCSFIGVDFDRQMLSFRDRTQHVVGNKMRLSSGDEIRLDEEWKASMEPHELRSIERITRKEAAACGYASSYSTEKRTEPSK